MQKDEEVNYWPSTFRKEEKTASDTASGVQNQEHVEVSYLEFLRLLQLPSKTVLLKFNSCSSVLDHQEEVVQESESRKLLQGTRQKHFVEQDDFYFPRKRYNGFDADRQDRFATRVAMKMTSKGVTEEIQGKWMDIWTKIDQGLADKIGAKMKEMM